MSVVASEFYSFWFAGNQNKLNSPLALIKILNSDLETFANETFQKKKYTQHKYTPHAALIVHNRDECFSRQREATSHSAHFLVG